MPEASDRDDQLGPASIDDGGKAPRGELVALRGALEGSHRELERARRRIEELENSTSWRLTRPFRAARGAIERLNRRPSRPVEHGTTARAPGVRDLGRDPAFPTTGDPGESPAKVVAFYLPQFHPIPENDVFWGPGFTEWTNVVRARPLFVDHYQPQLPTELGLYDLRVPEVLVHQARLAREHGIHGFCFHYYWFDGHRVLERPLEQFLASDEPDMPFCICWANENWTRRWDGRESDVLLRQTYEGDWAERFVRDLLPALADPRYLRVEGAALLLVYRVDQLPDPRRVSDLWRQEAQREAGLALHLAAVQSFGIDDPREYGFDAAVEFPPHPFSYSSSRERVRNLDPEFRGTLVDYTAVVDAAFARPLPDYTWYRSVMPSWDNTARRGRGAFVFLGSDPGTYGVWLRRIVDQARRRSAVQEPLVFVNAWNEWAEGAHLEPCERWGRGYLEATRGALADVSKPSLLRP